MDLLFSRLGAYRQERSLVCGISIECDDDLALPPRCILRFKDSNLLLEVSDEDEIECIAEPGPLGAGERWMDLVRKNDLGYIVDFWGLVNPRGFRDGVLIEFENSIRLQILAVAGMLDIGYVESRERPKNSGNQ